MYTIAPFEFFIIIIDDKSKVELNVYDIMGNEVDILLNDVVPSGIQSVSWDAKNQPSGIYFIRMLSGNFIEYKKAMLLK